ncbi:MAG: hypothetical protein IJT99_01190 [Clostridia bacterium]|nr:hypothetical protein [Clostridia bacterium]
MAKVKITPPKIDAETLSDKDMLRKILSYLYQLNEELRYQLTHIDEENVIEGGLTEAAISQNVYRKITRGDLETLVEAMAGQVKIVTTRLNDKLDADAPAVGVDNTAVLIDPDGIDVGTGEKGRIIARIGDTIQLQIDREGIDAIKGVFESLEAPNIVTCFNGGNAPWMGTIQATIDALPKFLKAETFITIPEGTYNESLNIMGFMGAPLNLINAEGEKVTIIGQISAKHCSNWIRIQATVAGLFEVYPPAGGNVYNATVIAQNIGLLSIWRLMVSGYRNPTSSTRTTSGINLSGCRFAVQDTCVEYTFRAILIGDGSSGTVSNCYGGGTTNYNTNGIGVILGSHVVEQGTKTFKSTNGNTFDTGTLIQYGALTQTEGGINYVAPTELTQTFSISKHCTYLLAWSRTPDTHAASMTQGSYRGTGGNERFYAGVMWFAGATSALAGKTIVSAQLAIRRSNGGYSNAIPVWLSSTTLTEANYNTTYEPQLTTPTNVGSLDKQQSGTYDVTSLMSAIQAGGGIALYEPKTTTVTDTWSPAYTHFYGKGSNYEPVLTVTYQ